MTISPLAPTSFPQLPVIAGVRLGGTHCGIRPQKKRTDLMLVELSEGTTAAGVFTLSLTASAPVLWCRKALKTGRGSGRLLVVNSGNSNAFTGSVGETAVTATINAAAALNGCAPEQVFTASTGVIGEPLPYERIVAALSGLYADLAEDRWEEAARAIMTTDTFPKASTRTFMLGDVQVRLNGFAKGSGMIAPHMGTMLAYLFTDAAIAPDVLQAMLERANGKSFNSITVDSDTSTSDTAMLFATGKAGNAPVTALDDPRAKAFQQALDEVMMELAHLIVKDGEGATKFVTIHVQGAESAVAARKIGLSIGNSPLVKTAIAGCDPNWGRIVMAVGKAGERANRDRLSIWIGDTHVAENGQVRADYREPPTAEYMKGQNITLRVDVGVGNGNATVWTCDLTKRYIEINADYRS